MVLQKLVIGIYIGLLIANNHGRVIPPVWSAWWLLYGAAIWVLLVLGSMLLVAHSGPAVFSNVSSVVTVPTDSIVCGLIVTLLVIGVWLTLLKVLTVGGLLAGNITLRVVILSLVVARLILLRLTWVVAILGVLWLALSVVGLSGIAR